KLVRPYARGIDRIKHAYRQLPFEYTIASRSTDVMVWNAVYDAHNEVACLMLGSMTPEPHRQFENTSPYEMLQELKSMFEKQAEVERETKTSWLCAPTRSYYWSDEVFSTWIEFGGNTRDLAHLEKKRTRLQTCTKIHQEVLFSELGDGVASIKRRHCDLSGDDV
ncbi:hypothetical protein Tco_0741289, partial [Tanacetum coccineum]